MSGHSKWSTIKRKKAKEDAKRGQMFGKLSRSITVAAREGGGNPDLNATLAAAIEKAKEYNMPQESIERAIKKGTGEISGAKYERMTYEGYGPEGVALIVEIMTDNRNRAASDLRNIFSRYHGNLGTPGCVSWMFERKGLIVAQKSEDLDEDTIMLMAIEAGAEDISPAGASYEIVTPASDLNRVKEFLLQQGLRIESAELTVLPKNQIRLDSEKALKVLKFVEALEDHDDVQEVYVNFEIPDQVMAQLTWEG
ncbi:hypothetical protein HKBW3S03_00873 [Candidatus Hakubella thermalkaliphila]|uniref:Probable transcriptional regulatory protein HKBW3S03_00873 n=1 Tax=Candidatus Hakubella thermalkaliphila TaxID=2754717 RepID=A0A6V8PIM2_9ACTN|nr:YebC/PmpR family DNA-binding transcriptional regulator [Candidatus Hakubella thermalkaliphila]GFP19368.1 hypothetical protein HKBW3S03_00873 [Candidatus Hakubella thermalkaliphila]GFP30806.1 hypothetical protein HKBW3S34_01726 [Candidatus Hakubella thermalkaliphila]GFP37257.1 hypothetical protein HKBW3S44_00937 [Candidatus Hakubella thermalkaliphila]GFP42438.1 hypothetical protein HKBW3C_01563 [Candidatus Hakubella thermalkaliphila]